MTDCPVFGHAEEGRDYRLRPGVYALIRSASGHLALVEGESDRFFFPGGGVEAGEDHVDALRREVLEECGWSIKVGNQLAEAQQYVAVPGEGHLLLHCHYYEAEVLSEANIEPEHGLKWATTEECGLLLHRECDCWVMAL